MAKLPSLPEKGLARKNPNRPAAVAGDSRPVLSELERMHSMYRTALWGILTFIAGSLMAFHFRQHTFTALIPADLVDLLGPVPPPSLIDVVLMVSTLSSLVLIAGRIVEERPPLRTSSLLAFQLCFYVIYFIADSLAVHFHAVFLSGMVIAILQHYHVRQHVVRFLEETALIPRFHGR